MKIALLSDLHDQVGIWKKIHPILSYEKIEEMIFCGDMCSGAVMAQVAKDFGKKIHLVFGNIDGDPFIMMQKARELPYLVIYGRIAELDIDGIKIHVNHYPDVAEGMAYTGKYDLVCFGHTHKKEIKKVNECIVVNPGTAGGLYSIPSFAIFNTQNKEIRFVDIT